MRFALPRSVAFVAACLTFAAPSFAQPSFDVSFQRDYAKLVKSGESPSALDGGLFGESVNLSTGATEFKATDVDVPGNFPIPMSIGRRFSVESRGNPLTRYPFGDWDIDVPYMSGIYGATGTTVTWQVTPDGTPNQYRCTTPQTRFEARPPVLSATVEMQPEEYWQGIHMYVPGAGSQEVLHFSDAAISHPTDGGAYKWVTKGNWFLKCTAGLDAGSPGSGDGFVARSPDGLIYQFDYMVEVDHPGMEIITGLPSNAQVVRKQIRLYATKVSDRHGNEVNYQWSNGRLTGITATDGRYIEIKYDNAAHDKITRIIVHPIVLDDPSLPPDQSRVWTYHYTSNGSSHTLQSVDLPDQKSWVFAIGNGVRSGLIPYLEPAAYDIELYCAHMRLFTQPSEADRTAVITHPSGAVGTFKFKAERLGRTNVPNDCRSPGGGTPARRAGDSDYNWNPPRFDVLSLESKSIDGPGLPASTGTGGYRWLYAFTQSPIGSYSNATSCTLPYCGDRVVQVTDPDGSTTKSPLAPASVPMRGSSRRWSASPSTAISRSGRRPTPTQAPEPELPSPIAWDFPRNRVETRSLPKR